MNLEFSIKHTQVFQTNKQTEDPPGANQQAGMYDKALNLMLLLLSYSVHFWPSLSGWVF